DYTIHSVCWERIRKWLESSSVRGFGRTWRAFVWARTLDPRRGGARPLRRTLNPHRGGTTISCFSNPAPDHERDKVGEVSGCDRLPHSRVPDCDKFFFGKTLQLLFTLCTIICFRHPGLRTGAQWPDTRAHPLRRIRESSRGAAAEPRLRRAGRRTPHRSRRRTPRHGRAPPESHDPRS